MTILNLQPDIYEIENAYNEWEGWQEYLKGDSVFKSRVTYKYKTNSCVNSESDDNSVELSFVDDKLYKMELEISFKPNILNKCLENYHQVFESLKKAFPISYPKTIYKDDSKKEQIGEGYSLYKKDINFTKPIKFEEAEVEYRVKYEYDYKISKETSTIKYYVLEITYVNLKGTKLDNRGY